MANKNIIATVALAGVFGGTMLAPAHAQRGPGGWHHDPLLEGVTLTSAQQTQVAALRKSNWQADRTLFDQLHAIQEKIDAALLASGTVTEASVAPLLQQKEAVQQQLDAARLAEQVAVRNLLTDAQVSAASANHAQMESLHAQERALHAQGQGPDAPPPPEGG